MDRFFAWFFRGLGQLVLWFFRSLGGLIAELCREIGRLIARFLPWAIGAGVVVGMIKFMPEVVGPLIGIVFCIGALWVMVRGILPGGKKKK